MEVEPGFFDHQRPFKAAPGFFAFGAQDLEQIQGLDLGQIERLALEPSSENALGFDQLVAIAGDEGEPRLAHAQRTTRYATIGTERPLSRSSPRLSVGILPPSRRWVSWPITMSPGLATFSSSRAARLTVLPSTV